MSNIFTGLNIGRSALLAHQAAIDVTGHNLSNVNTDGYSRQRVELNPALAEVTAQGSLGTGVQLDGVERVQLSYLERQLGRASTQHGYDAALAQGLGELETVLGEPSDSGLGAALTELWNSWDALAARPTDAALRAQVVDRAEHLATVYNQKLDDLAAVQDRFDEAVQESVDQINGWTRELAELNGSIAKAEASGHTANDLRDQRDRLVRDLSAEMGVEVETDGSYLNVRVPGDGPYLVSRIASYEIQGYPDADGYLSDFRVETAPVTPRGGKIGALLDLRDTHVPQLREDLSRWMATVSDRVNGLHAAGTDRDGQAGGVLFEWSGSADQVTFGSDSAGILEVSGYDALPAGTHRLRVESVDGASAIARGDLSVGSATLTIANLATFGTDYTGPETLNLDYHLRAVGPDAVQLYRGDDAVGEAQSVTAGATTNLTWAGVDGLSFAASVTLGAGESLVMGERSDGWLTTGTVSLDGGAAQTVDITAANNITFPAGTELGYLGAGSAVINFSGDPVPTGTFTVYDPAGTLRVAAGISADPDKLAAGYDADGAAGAGDGENARRIADLAVRDIFETVGETPSGYLGKVVQELGAKTRDAETFQDASGSVLLQVEAQQQSISGVNLDEEMVQLIQFQRGYEAAARFLTTVDGMIDTLINRVGLVGR